MTFSGIAEFVKWAKKKPLRGCEGKFLGII